MSAWQRDPRTLWRRSGDRVLVSPPDRDDSLLLDGSGAVTWQLLASPVEEDQLVTQLTQLFDVDSATVRAEIGPFLRELAALDVVRQC